MNRGQALTIIDQCDIPEYSALNPDLAIDILIEMAEQSWRGTGWMTASRVQELREAIVWLREREANIDWLIANSERAKWLDR